MSHKYASGDAGMIKFKGTFDLDGVFAFVTNWMFHNEFSNYNEPVYKHKLPEIQRKFTGYQKRTAYIKETVTFDCHFWSVKPVEVVKDGKKKKMYTGRGEMQMSFVIETDWEGKWDTTPARVKMRNFYDKYIIRNNLDMEYVDPLENKLNDFMTDLKKLLGMEAT